MVDCDTPIAFAISDCLFLALHIIVGRDNVLGKNGRSIQQKMRAYLFNYENQVKGMTLDDNGVDKYRIALYGEYRFIAGKMSPSKWGQSQEDKVYKDTYQTKNHNDISFYAKDNARPYLGEITDFGQGDMGDKNTIDKGNFNFFLDIDTSKDPYEPGSGILNTFSTEGLSKIRKGRRINDYSGYVEGVPPDPEKSDKIYP